MSMSRELEAHLGQEILESERLRMAILAALFALLTLVFPLFAALFHEEYRVTFASRGMLWTAMTISGALVAYEMLARRLLPIFARRGGTAVVVLRYWNAFLETSVPSLLIWMAGRNVEAQFVLGGPAVLLYAVFIVLSTLRLEARISIFTGLVAAAEFAILSFHYDAPRGLTLMKALLLVLAGVAAGFVAAELRRRIAKAFHALRERERVMSAFGQQVSPQVAEAILRQGAGIASRRGFVCVMFMDIRNFTPLAESRSPEEIVALQNDVFGIAIEVINRHRGVINQFLGDGFMATFGAPLSTGEECRDAVAAGRELVERIRQVEIGVGLHAGDAVSGNIGSAERKQYSVTGTVVILASRIEQLNKQFGSRLLVSREVLERAGERGAGAMPLGPIHVKGHAAPIEVYRLA
ncbi:MAG TPA: adenylate/guanylate cyclase domain-containing protein [Burkholderiales bacterium]|nr:adenylate/guanylate cyclase domain-containing protein [Burkholderiales bacterium]